MDASESSIAYSSYSEVYASATGEEYFSTDSKDVSSEMDASSPTGSSSTLSSEEYSESISDALHIIDEVISLSNSIRINLHQSNRLVDFYRRARSYFDELGRSGVSEFQGQLFENPSDGSLERLYVQKQLFNDAIDALQKGLSLIEGYVEKNWLKSIEDTGVNQDAFAKIHVKLEDSCWVICENVIVAGVADNNYTHRARLYLLLEFDTLAPLYFLNDEDRATLFERDAQMDKKHMLEIIRGSSQYKNLIERTESTTITTNRLIAAMGREQGPMAGAVWRNKRAKVVLMKKLVKEKAKENERLKAREASSPPTGPDLLQDFKIESSEIQIGENIGSGGFATIHKCQWQNRDYALKMFKVTDVEELRTEVQNLVLLPRHPNVVLLVGFSFQKTDGTPMLLMELLDGDLHTLVCKGVKHRLTNKMSRLFRRDKSGLSIAIKIDFIYQIARGMLFLHKRKVFHGDLKAKNVLVKQRPGDSIQLKITDFGLSEKLIFERQTWKKRNSDEELNCSTFSDHSSLGFREIRQEGNVQRVVVGNVGTVRWMAPEVYGVSGTTEIEPFSMKADIYSFAMTCVEILTGQHPFPHIESTKDVRVHVKSGERPDLSTLKNGFPEALLHLVKRCWDNSPSRRPDFSEIYSSMQELKKAFPMI